MVKAHPMGRVAGRKRRGFALVLTSLMMVFVVSLMGMAVDAGVLFAIRGRLSSAADSAAQAASRSVNLGVDAADANARATRAAVHFLKANFPRGYLGVEPSQSSVSANYNLAATGGKPTGLLEVSVHAEVAAPVYFMKFWGVSSVPVAVEGRATRRNLVVIMVLDKSASCEGMLFSAAQMVDYFSPYDYVGLVSYDATADIDFPASTNFKGNAPGSLKDRISRLTCGGHSNTTAALEAAYQEIQRIDQRLAVNAVVLFTASVPNGVNANFPLRTQVDTRWGPATNVPDQHPDAADCRSDSRECTDMPVACPSGARMGVLAQAAGFALSSGPRAGLLRGFPSDSLPLFPAACPASGSAMASQSLAYIPDTDRFGNSTHGPKDNWVFQVNRQCLPGSVAVTAGAARCRNIGGEWGSFTSEWVDQSPGTNFFAAGPYAGKLRTDQANAIGVASMNTAINQAGRMRSDPSYRIRLHSIYLEGHGTGPVDRQFLPIMSNLRVIPPLLYQPPETPGLDNPLYEPGQPEGSYAQSVNAQEVGSHFAEVASSLLRLSGAQ